MSRTSRERPDDWALVSRLYHEARGRDASEREAFLRQACPDEALRAEVRSLLAYADSSGDRDLLSLKAEDAAVTDTVAAAPWIGRDVPGYQISGVLGAGGMGVVYKAMDTTLRRPVAIKFLDASGDASARTRFLREAHTASSLNHPHILTVHDAGEIDGRQFLVTEYVDGGTLRRWAQSEPRTPQQIVDLLAGVADALATAHDAGIVHRDVKPENILVTSSGYAKLADFGLAKPSAAADATQAGDGAAVTRSGMMVGTVAYMAPEQAIGGTADARSDVFAFGIVLHELLAGRRPFAGASSLEELQRIVHGTPEPLPASVPKALRAIVDRALQKAPAQRYQTMRELTADLRAAARESGAVPAAAAAARWSRRQRLAAVLVASVLGLSAAAGIWWRGTSTVASPAVRSIAVLPFKNLSADPAQEYFSDGMTESLIANLAQIRSLRVISRRSVMQFKDTTRTIPDIARALGVDAVVQSSVARDGGRVRIRAQLIDAASDTHLWSKEFNGPADDVLGLQSDVTQAIANEIRPDATGSANTRTAAARRVAPAAQDAYMLGRYLHEKHTKEGYEGAIRAFERAVSLQPDFATAYAMLGAVWMDAVGRGYLADRGDGRRAALKAIEIDPDDAAAQAVVGALRSEDWDWEGAERAFRRSHELDPDDAYGCGCYAILLITVGRSSEALAMAQHAVDVSPLSSSAHNNLGFVLFHSSRFKESVAPLERALELERGNIVARMLLSEAYLRLGRDEDALRIGKETFDTHLASLYAARPQTRRDAEEILARAERNGIPPGQNWSAGVAYMRLGQRDRAFEYLTKEFDQRGAYVRYSRPSPWFDEFRSDPRFDALIRRLHLPN